MMEVVPLQAPSSASLWASNLTFGADETSAKEHAVSIMSRYPSHTHQLQVFLSQFEENDGKVAKPKYVEQLKQIASRKSRVLLISLDDLYQFFAPDHKDDGNQNQTDPPKAGKTAKIIDPSIPAAVESNSLRYVKLLYEASNSVMSSLKPIESGSTMFTDRGDGQLETMEAAGVPVYLRSPYEVRLAPRSNSQPLAVRDAKARHIGKLVTMEGMVTKISSVKPRLQVARYRCQACHADALQPVQGPSFMPLTICQSRACSATRTRGEMQLVLADSKFTQHQEARIQEPPEQVPRGSMPRLQKVLFEGSLVRLVSPGMHVILTGVLLPQETRTTHRHQRSIACVPETQLLVQNVRILGGTASTAMTSVHECTLTRCRRDPDLYSRLARSLAPAVHDLHDVKRALLLQLVGAPTEKFGDGMVLRGDIHILLMGDPGVAKSQLLSQIYRIAPRAHYATGKGSSGVGLTASVVRDSTTGDLTLEGGAIVLADRGVCCIDEFDKMDETDRSAIHEVMEQQTVSISKAGLTATLNARTAILAAANPQYGRYDISKSPMQNINLPAALLSRFDVQYLMLDRAIREADVRLATHVLRVHQTNSAAANLANDSVGEADYFYSTDEIRTIVAEAKRYTPKLEPTLIQDIVENYCELRQREKAESREVSSETYTTPRTLFAVLRLSQALARLRFSNVVDHGDFEEALRLLGECRRSLDIAQESQAGVRNREDFHGEVLELLRGLDSRLSKKPNWEGWVQVSELEAAAMRAGFSRSQLNAALDTYLELDVLQWKNEHKNLIGFIDRIND